MKITAADTTVRRVALSEVAADAYLNADYAALEAIESWVEERYGKEAATWEVALKRLSVMDRKLIVLMLEHCLHGATAEAILDAMTLADIADRMSDAVTLRLYGRTLAEEVAHRESTALERMKKLEQANV
ncbi:MAG TPA: hypothetical protein VGN79_14320 [Devosia sp.]|jgi:hypothetical protein|nr:hypothetical protein [Devosia sp.]